MLFSGLVGLVTYLAVSGLDGYFDEKLEEDEDEESIQTTTVRGTGVAVQTAGKAGLSTFLYLEVLDASFSFDGVIGAFAISSNVLVIAAGLGIGALFVRSMTVYLVREGTLAQYRFLEHGAHWAIGGLALILFLELRVHIPEADHRPARRRAHHRLARLLRAGQPQGRRRAQRRRARGLGPDARPLTRPGHDERAPTGTSGRGPLSCGAAVPALAGAVLLAPGRPAHAPAVRGVELGLGALDVVHLAA